MAGCCSNGQVLIYPCGGGSNTGEIADRVARLMQKNKTGKMSCLASLGAHIDGFIVSARDADLNITVDGCPVACARKIFEHLGLKFRSYVLTEMSIVKGQTEVTQEIVEKTCVEIASGIKIGTDNYKLGACSCGC